MDDYYLASQERKIDSNCLNIQNRYHCAVYILGYVIEFLFKFLLHLKGLDVPKKKDGHNLKLLMTRNKLHSRIFADHWQKSFINIWNVGMRYRANDFEGNELEAKHYLRAAGRIIGILEFEIKKLRR